MAIDNDMNEQTTGSAAVNTAEAIHARLATGSGSSFTLLQSSDL